MSSRVEAVILDWAGTSVDFGSLAPARAFVALFGRHGVALSEAEARGPMGTAKREHIRRLLALPAVADRWREATGGLPDEGVLDRLYAEFLPLQLAIIADHAEPVPGCIEAVEACRARGIRIGATTGYAAEMMAVLEPAARARGFAPEVSVSASEVPVGRPAPAMALLAAARLGVGAVAACVKLDDTPVGIEEGRNAGMWTVGVALSGNECGLSAAALSGLAAGERERRREVAETRLREAGAHFVIDSIAELLPVLDAIEARLRQGGRP